MSRRPREEGRVHVELPGPRVALLGRAGEEPQGEAHRGPPPPHILVEITEKAPVTRVDLGRQSEEQHGAFEGVEAEAPGQLGKTQAYPGVERGALALFVQGETRRRRGVRLGPRRFEQVPRAPEASEREIGAEVAQASALKLFERSGRRMRSTPTLHLPAESQIEQL